MNRTIHGRVNEESKMKQPTDIMLCTNRQEEQIKITVRKNLHPFYGQNVEGSGHIGFCVIVKSTPHTLVRVWTGVGLLESPHSLT